MALRLRIRELIEEKAEREQRRLTQDDIARELGISSSVLSRYANGYVSGFKNEVVEKLLDYFEVPIEKLYERVKDKQA